MQHTLSYYSTILYKDFFAFATDELLELGLNYGAIPFIIYVGKFPNCTPAELTHAMKIDWGYSQRSITKLVQLKFMTKVKDTENGRNYHLNLTKTGKEAYKLSHKVFFSWDDEKLNVLNSSEKSELFYLLGKLTRNRSDSQ